MALRYSLDMGDWADKVEASIAAALDSGLRTGDIMQDGMTEAGTTQMTDAILAELEKAAS